MQPNEVSKEASRGDQEPTNRTENENPVADLALSSRMNSSRAAAPEADQEPETPLSSDGNSIIGESSPSPLPGSTAGSQNSGVKKEQITDQMARMQYQQDIDCCIGKGNLAIRNNDFRSCAEHFEQAYVLLNTLGVQDPLRKKHCLRSLIHAYLQLEDADRALSALNDLGRIDPKAVDSAETVSVLTKAGTFYSNQNRYDESSRIFRKALELAGTALATDDPLSHELNRAYITLYQKYSTTPATSGHVKEEEAQKLTGFTKKQPVDWLGKPLTSTPGHHIAGSTYNQVRNRLVKTARGAADQAAGNALLHSPWFLLLLSAIILSCAARVFVVCHLERSVSAKLPAAMPTHLSGMQFQSCDRKNTAKFLSPSECVIYQSGRNTHAKYAMVSGNLVDLMTLFPGYRQRSDLWYQVTTAGLVDNDKLVMYGQKSPELAVVNKMWWYADFAQDYYKDCRLYPSDTEKCKHSNPNFVYVNPITGQADYAAIILQKQPDGGPDLTSRAGSERTWRPGAIFCTCTNYKKFVVCGFDRLGRPLTGSDPNRYFFIECKNGINLTKVDELHAENQPRSAENRTPVRVLLYLTPDFEATVQWARRLVQVFLWLGSCTAAFWCYASHKAGYSRPIKLCSLIATALSLLCLVAWYVVNATDAPFIW